MRKEIILLFFSFFALVLSAKEVTVTYPKPYQYEKRGNTVCVKAKIIPDNKISGKLTATYGNTAIETSVEGNEIIIWLPLIGSNRELKITTDKKQVLVDQMFQPLIPADWGYFQNGVIHIISSSHQDIAWINTPDSCRMSRIHEIILPSLKMMETDKNFAFGMEQTFNLMEFLEEHPEKKEEVIQRYKENRFAWGATFNQPYEGLESGEQLVRQAYYGRKWIRENLPGCDDVTAYNIDVPGRTWQMPQILAKSGIKNLFVSRMREGLYDWYAPDGSSVFTYTPGNYGWAAMFWKFFDEDAVTAFHKIHERSVLWSDYFNSRDIPPHYAVVISNDASGPANYKKVVDEWNKIADMSEIPLPHLQHSTAESYFNIVNVPQSQKEKISGERPDLWLYIHGPAHYEAIKAKRRAAVLLPAAEAFTTFNCLLENNLSTYPRKAFDEAWIASIYPDHGWGGKNGDITDSIFRASLEKGENEGYRLLNKALTSISNKIETKKNAIVVFNDLNWIRTTEACVKIDASNISNSIVTDSEGKIVPSQVKKDNTGKYKLVFVAENIPSMGYATFYLSKGKQNNTNNAKILPNYYENEFYKLSFGNGGLTGWFDKQLNKELLNTAKINGGDILNLGYHGNGAGEFTRIIPIAPGDFHTLTSMNTLWNVVENGAIYCIYENRQKYGSTGMIQRIVVYHNTKKVDFDITVENYDGAHGRQFRFALPLNMINGTINYEVPMGVLQVGRDEMKTRPGGWAWDGTYTQLPEEINPREIQNFISANGNGFGLTMGSGVAVADWVDPSRETADYNILQAIMMSTHKSCHGQGNWYEQKGTHDFHFSVMSHKEGWENGYQFGVEANHPLITVLKPEKTKGILPLSYSFLSVSNPFVAVNTVKKADADNGVIVRLAEMKGESTDVKISIFKPVKFSSKTNLIEDEAEKSNLTGNSFVFPIEHHAIETLKFNF